jgi:hypothetical protein
VLAHGVREPSRPWDALYGAGGVGRALEVPKWLPEGVVVRAPRRRTGGSEASTVEAWRTSVSALSAKAIRWREREFASPTWRSSTFIWRIFRLSVPSAAFTPRKGC